MHKSYSNIKKTIYNIYKKYTFVTILTFAVIFSRLPQLTEEKEMESEPLRIKRNLRKGE